MGSAPAVPAAARLLSASEAVTAPPRPHRRPPQNFLYPSGKELLRIPRFWSDAHPIVARLLSAHYVPSVRHSHLKDIPAEAHLRWACVHGIRPGVCLVGGRRETEDGFARADDIVFEGVCGKYPITQVVMTFNGHLLLHIGEGNGLPVMPDGSTVTLAFRNNAVFDLEAAWE